jgi:hypothetical protein
MDIMDTVDKVDPASSNDSAVADRMDGINRIADFGFKKRSSPSSFGG